MTQLIVLHQLGWNIHKVWSVEWWEKPDQLFNDILEAIRLAENNEHRAVVSPVETFTAIAPILNSTQPFLFEATVDEIEPTVTEASSSDSNDTFFYQVAKLEQVSTYNSEEFLWPQNRGKIKKQITEVIETEWPISKNLLCKRVLNAWGISRMGIRISAHFQTLFDDLMQIPFKHGQREFFWHSTDEMKNYIIYRIPQNDPEKRDADDLPPEEVSNAIREILSHQISLSKADLIRETAKLFGYARVGTNVEYAMSQGIEKAKEQGIAVENNGRIVFAG